METPINLKAILFDLDGTLADSLDVMRISYQIFLKEFDCQPTNEEFDLINGPPLCEVVRLLKLEHALKDDEEVLLSKYYNIIDHFYAKVQPSLGAKNLIKKAKKYHFTIGVVTSNTKTRTQTWLNTVDLSSMVDFVVSGEDVTHGKPHPEPYIIASKKIKCGSPEILVIEDSFQGAISATEAGLKTFVLNVKDNNHYWPESVELISSLVQASEKIFII